MMRNVLIILMLTTLLLGQCPTTAEASSAGSFITRPVGARSLGMGSAVVAVAQDGTMGFWNPAGLAMINRSEINSMQGTILGDVEYLYLGYNRLPDTQTWDTALGVNIINTRVDGIKEATYKNGDGLLTGKSFSYEGNAYVFSAAKALDRRLAVGANLKYVQETLYRNSAAGLGFDTGLLYRVNSRVNIGLVYQNILPTQLTWDTRNDTVETVPFNTILGIAYRITDKFMLAVDVNSRSDRGLGLVVGGELILNRYFTVRAGVDQGRLLLGTSLHYQQFGLHYAFATEPVGEIVDNKHYLSLSYILDEQEDLIEPLIEEKAPKAVPALPGPPEKIEEIPMIEVTKEVSLKSMTVKKINNLIETELLLNNTGTIPAKVRATLSIYDSEMNLLKLFPAQRTELNPGTERAVKFSWFRTTDLPYGTYYFKGRIAYNGSEKSVVKRVVRR